MHTHVHFHSCTVLQNNNLGISVTDLCEIFHKCFHYLCLAESACRDEMHQETLINFKRFSSDLTCICFHRRHLMKLPEKGAQLFQLYCFPIITAILNCPLILNFGIFNVQLRYR